MTAKAYRGSLGTPSNCPVIDPGTRCLSESCAPSVIGSPSMSNKGPGKDTPMGFGVLSEVAFGDFHAGETTWSGTAINVGVGLIPIVGQIADARDTAAAVVKVWDKPSSRLAWAGLGMAIVGWIPLLGDAAKGATKVGRKVTGEVTRNADEVIAKKAAPGLGEQLIKQNQRSGYNVDIAAQEYRHKAAYREGSGKDVQSAHMVNSSSVSDISDYIRGKALTVLLPAKQHKAFDDYWKAWARDKLAKAGAGAEVKVTVAEWEKVINRALASVPELQGRTADTMSWMIQIELYQTLKLKPDQLIRVPFSK